MKLLSLLQSEKGHPVYSKITLFPKKWMQPDLATILTQVESRHQDFSYQSYWHSSTGRLTSRNSQSSRNTDTGTHQIPGCTSFGNQVWGSLIHVVPSLYPPTCSALYMAAWLGLGEAMCTIQYTHDAIFPAQMIRSLFYAFALVFLSSWNVFHILLHLANLYSTIRCQVPVSFSLIFFHPVEFLMHKE